MGLSHGIQADIEGQQVIFAPPEYVIVRKLQFFREGGSQKHLRDISRMLIGLGEDWNRETLMTMIQTHRLQDDWRKVLEHAD